MNRKTWVLASSLICLGLLTAQGMAQGLFEPGSPTSGNVQTSDPATLFRQNSAPAQPQYFQLDQPIQQTNQAPPSFDPDFDPNVDPAVELPTEELTAEDPDGPVFELDLRQQLGTEGGGSGPSFGGGGQGSGGGAAGSGAGSGSGQGGFGQGGLGNGGSGQGGFGGGQGGSGLSTGTQQRYPQVTGLIVDARGLDFEPSMSMRLFDPDGNQIYTVPGSSDSLNTALVAGEGTAAYATSDAQARSLAIRIGERPHQIRAIRTLGYDLVISNEDAWFLRQTNEMDRYLDNLSVVVIWDPSFT